MTIIPQLWLRIHFLVPDPQCQTFADDFDRIVWNDGRTQPTEVQLNAVTQTDIDNTAAQVTVDGQRAEAVTRADLDIGTRELVEVLLFEINKLNTRMQEIQDAFTAVKGTAGGSDNIRAAIPGPGTPSNPAVAAFANVSPKTRGQVLQKYVDDINAGTADP